MLAYTAYVCITVCMYNFIYPRVDEAVSASSNYMLICRAFPTPTSTSDKDQTTTPGTQCPTLCEKCVASLTSPANQYREDAGDGAYGLQSEFSTCVIIYFKIR